MQNGIDPAELGEVTAVPPRGGGNLRTLAEIEADLSRRLPPRLLGTKTKGGRQITYFSVWTAQKLLDLFAHGWQSYNTFSLSGERVVCDTRLCIPTSDYGLVCRSGSGDDSEDEDEPEAFATEAARKAFETEQRQRQYGSPATRAEGQSLKRAAARFGLGVYLRGSTNTNGNQRGER
jgi:hypothetical protein